MTLPVEHKLALCALAVIAVTRLLIESSILAVSMTATDAATAVVSVAELGFG